MELLKLLQFGSPTRKFSPTIRRFAFTLNFYSPKAYDYVRNTFSQYLPAARTLRGWYSAINGSPGFTDESFDALKERAKIEKEKGRQLRICLMLDGVYIRQQSQWDNAGKKFLGHNMVRNECDSASLPLATQALVFMVCGIENDFKIPIGYFMNNGANYNEIADMETEAMYRLSQIGIRVASLTYDGAKENIKAVKSLGATLEAPYIINHFDDDSKVYLILDVPHMIKLARNCLGNNGVLYNKEGDEILWKFIKDLVDLQISENINLGNKLTKSHVEFADNKMNVRLATQTLSNSSASSIQYLDEHSKHPNFANSKATIEYLRIFNNLFDTMNSKLNHSDDKFKRPFSQDTLDIFNSLFERAKTFIKGLSIMENGNKKPILDSRSYTPFFGFLQNMDSFNGIYKDYVNGTDLAEFYAFAASQDHLETFFGCVRRMNGCNDNPTEQQFVAAYKKLLFQNEVTTSRKSNCLNDVTKILNVCSSKKQTSGSNVQYERDLQLLADYDFEHPEFNLLLEDSNTTTKLHEHAEAYVASIVESTVIRKIIAKQSKRCSECINAFMADEMASDEFIDFKAQTDGIYQPCKSTLSIIHETERILKKYTHLEISFDASVAHILRNIDISQLFQNTEFGETHNHKIDLIKLIIETYLHHKSRYVSQLVTRLSKKKLIRHNNLKLIHQAGQ